MHLMSHFLICFSPSSLTASQASIASAILFSLATVLPAACVNAVLDQPAYLHAYAANFLVCLLINVKLILRLLIVSFSQGLREHAEVPADVSRASYVLLDVLPGSCVFCSMLFFFFPVSNSCTVTAAKDRFAARGGSPGFRIVVESTGANSIYQAIFFSSISIACVAPLHPRSFLLRKLAHGLSIPQHKVVRVQFLAIFLSFLTLHSQDVFDLYLASVREEFAVFTKASIQFRLILSFSL
jgi:hypothetical protein